MRVSVKNQVSEKYELSREVWIPDAWIIERERRRKQEKENRERPCLQLPVPSSEPHVDEDEDESQAGSTVIVIDLQLVRCSRRFAYQSLTSHPR